jgi:hypothetical protein
VGLSPRPRPAKLMLENSHQRRGTDCPARRSGCSFFAFLEDGGRERVPDVGPLDARDYLEPRKRRHAGEGAPDGRRMPRTTQLYDRREDRVTLNEVDRHQSMTGFARMHQSVPPCSRPSRHGLKASDHEETRSDSRP